VHVMGRGERVETIEADMEDLSLELRARLTTSPLGIPVFALAV